VRLARELDPVEIRVLGSLLEKQQTTPDAYPLTRNALVLACNQRSNREPVTDFSDGEVEAALDRLRELVLVWKVEGARTERWEHNLDARWELHGDAKAVLTLLFLRGAQTPGELRTRAERMHDFTTLADVEASLQRMASESEPLVFELPRRPGQKETRWSHLAGSAPPGTSRPEPIATADEEAPLARRVARLEALVAELDADLKSLKRKLGE
jgi:uncharacterized protein YceH (UPF0502 family)